MRQHVKNFAQYGIFVLLLILVYFFLKWNIAHSYSMNILLDQHLDLTINEETYTDITLSEFPFKDLNKGDKIVIQGKIPKEHIDAAVMQFHVYHATIDLYIERKLIYTEGQEAYRNNDFIGGSYNWMSIPSGYEGKPFRLELRITENNPFNSLEPIKFQSERVLIRNFMVENLVQIIIAVLMFCVSILLVSAKVLIGKRRWQHKSLLYVAAISCMTSFWILSNTGVINFFIENSPTVAVIEYIMSYSMVPFLFLYALEIRKEKRVRDAMKGCFVMSIVFGVMAVGLHYLHIVHLSQVVFVQHILLMVGYAIMVLESVSSNKVKNNPSQKVQLWGINMACTILVMDVIRLVIFKSIAHNNVFEYESFLPIASLILVITLCVASMYRVGQAFYEAGEKKTLEEIAYTDALTGIANRAKCIERFSNYNNKVQDLCVITFDLNDFKRVNDEFGHLRGDAMLITFATMLKQTYEEIGFIGRMGGDEFLVVLVNSEEEYIVETLQQLSRRCSEYKEQNISFAYGYACNAPDNTVDIWGLYEAADQAMYRCKNRQKLSNKINQVTANFTFE